MSYWDYWHPAHSPDGDGLTFSMFVGFLGLSEMRMTRTREEQSKASYPSDSWRCMKSRGSVIDYGWV
jgi:hypothetical protein